MTLLGVELFHKGGIYEFSGGRVRVGGTYAAENDKLCVKTSRERNYCRAMFVDRAGEIYIEPEPVAGATRKLQHIRLTPVDPNSACGRIASSKGRGG